MTETTTKLAVPDIHPNGTHPDTLINDIVEAREKIREAIAALSKCAPNGRDYYARVDNNYSDARNQHIERLKKLHDVNAELAELSMAIDAARR